MRTKERDRLSDDVDRGWRLACQTYTSGDVTISWGEPVGPALSGRAAEKLRERWLAAPDDEGETGAGSHVG